MSSHRRKARKRDGFVLTSGSVVESNPTPTATSLVQDTAAVPGSVPTPQGIPLINSPVPDNTSATAVPPPAPTSGTSSSVSSGHQIPLATAIGACVGAFIALLLAIALALHCSRRQHKPSTSRNAMNDASRRRSHLQTWFRVRDGADRGQERPARRHRLSGPLGAMFHRTMTSVSGEKSEEEHNRESIGTMQHFAKYHPGLAAEMASQGVTKGVDREIAKPPPVLHTVGRGSDMTPPISWDGETIDGDSFQSYRGLSRGMSPLMMATEKSTPPATFSSLHRWERAEVVHVSQTDSNTSSGVVGIQNPFSDRNTVKGNVRGQNPFFGARGYAVRRALPHDTHKDPFADTQSPVESPPAIRSLIAALESPPGLDPSGRIASFQSSVYSRATGDDESAISVTAFPYPPTQINFR